MKVSRVWLYIRIPIVRGRNGWTCYSRSCSGRRIRSGLPTSAAAISRLDNSHALLRLDGVHLKEKETDIITTLRVNNGYNLQGCHCNTPSRQVSGYVSPPLQHWPDRPRSGGARGEFPHWECGRSLCSSPEYALSPSLVC